MGFLPSQCMPSHCFITSLHYPFGRDGRPYILNFSKNYLFLFYIANIRLIFETCNFFLLKSDNQLIFFCLFIIYHLFHNANILFIFVFSNFLLLKFVISYELFSNHQLKISFVFQSNLFECLLH